MVIAPNIKLFFGKYERYSELRFMLQYYFIHHNYK